MLNIFITLLLRVGHAAPYCGWTLERLVRWVWVVVLLWALSYAGLTVMSTSYTETDHVATVWLSLTHTLDTR